MNRIGKIVWHLFVFKSKIDELGFDLFRIKIKLYLTAKKYLKPRAL